MKIALKIVSLLVIVLILAVAALLFAGVPSGVMNALLGDRIARDSGVKVTFDGATRIGLFPLHLTAHDVTLVPPGNDGVRLSVERIEAAITLASLMSGEPTASSVTLTQPVLHAPLIRERARSVPVSTTPTPPRRVAVEQIIVRDAAVVLSDPVARIEQRADGISADVQISPQRRVSIKGSARLGDAPASFTAKTRLATASDRQAAPFELTFDAPGVLPRSLTAMGDVKIAGALVSISNLSGRLGDEAFNGWASADLSSKPVIKLDLDFPQLSFDAPQWRENRGGESGWSTRPFDFAGLNYADAQALLSVAELKIGTLRVIPAALDLTLGAGALKVQASRLGVGGGEIDGDVVIDASGAVPDLSLRADVTNVRARPLLSSLAGFDRIDGRMSAKLVLRGTGGHPKALAGTIGGTAFTAITDGEIVGVNLAQMIRTLTGSTLNGWQESASETTDLSQLSASFRLERGQGSTTDLVLAGPLVRMSGAGNIDLVSETMAFRVEPRLVMSLQGQPAPGAAAMPAQTPAPTPVGLGVPVIVQGPWASPRIYPEMAGMLENPEAAYSQLRQMGQGLFGRDLLGKDLQGMIGQPGGTGPNGIGQAIGSIIQGLGAGQQPANAPEGKTAAPPPADPNAPSPMNDIMKRLFGR